MARKAPASAGRFNAPADPESLAPSPDLEGARAQYLLAYPSCKRCGGKAEVVRDIQPIREAPHRRLDRTNFEALCAPCASGQSPAQERS